jgi:predicted RNA-binding Zn ribbon-like protein
VALPAWVPEAETKPAPLPLLVVQSFVNTWEADTGVDLLADEQRAARWLRQAGLLDDADAAPEVPAPSLLREVREAIRALLVLNAGGPEPGDEARRVLHQAAAGCLVRPVLHEGGRVELEAAGDGAWATRLLLIVRDAQRDGSWGRLKACRNEECTWAFYDRSHAGRGAWCDMAVCGNRIKNRNLRTRRAAAAGRAHTSGAGDSASR